MEKRKIGLDLDDTLNNLVHVWAKWIREDHDPDFQYENCKAWDLSKLSKGGSRVYDFLRMPGTFFNLEPVNGARDIVDALIADKDNEVRIVTAYVPESCFDKAKWLKLHFPSIEERNIIFCNDKHLIDLDYLIDDGPHNFEKFKGKGILIDRPWNQHVKPDNINLFRAHDWTEVGHIMNNFTNLKLNEPHINENTPSFRNRL